MFIDFLTVILLLFFIYVNFSLLGNIVLNSLKIDLNINYSFFLGNIIFITLLTFLFDYINLNIDTIINIFSLLSLFLLIKFLIDNSIFYKKIFLNFLIFYFPVILLFIVVALLHRENFYVFRGNYWDLFSQISYGLVLSENNLSDFKQLVINEYNSLKTFDHSQVGEPYSKSYYFYLMEVASHRKLQGLYLAILYNLKSVDIFILTYALKVFFISCIPASFFLLINELSTKLSFIKKYILSLTFAFSTWSIYIFEIDALAQITTFPLSIVLLALGLQFFKHQNNPRFIIYFLAFISASMFLSYPEQASVAIASIFLLIIIYRRDILRNKDTYLALLLFLILTSSQLYNYTDAALQMARAKNDFWGYFGSFILGSNNLVSDKENLKLVELIISNNQINNFSKILEIVNLHIEKGYNHIFLTIIPSLSGYYYLANGQNLTYINLFFLLAINIYLIFIIFQNLKVIISENELTNIYIRYYILFIFSLILIFIYQFKIYIVLKIFFYYSPIFYILLVYNFKKNNIHYLLVIPLIIFPIIKYSENNNGIGKLDSFPSILNKDFKQNINWYLSIENAKECKNINLKVNEQIPNMYASFFLDFYKLKYFNNSKFVNNVEQEASSFDCEIFLHKGNFTFK